MSIMYAVSDIHGFFDEMMETLSLVDLDSNRDNQLIFLGDYINRGPKSCQVLYKIKELEETYPEQVIVLIGNHDQMFIDWWGEDFWLWLEQDQELMATKSFFTDEQWDCMLKKVQVIENPRTRMNGLLKSELKKNHRELLQWLFAKNASLYYETSNQIFVHAGICEEDEELWKHATEEGEYTWKFPVETGSFYKDIIAGHVSSVTVSEDESYLGKVYWDKESHFFIDGETNKSYVIPLLKYDTNTKLYSSYEKNIEFSIAKSKAK
ncbi:metallophosphoesterase [Rummeliibacillus sp. BSL5]